jgi:hypothetical protein
VSRDDAHDHPFRSRFGGRSGSPHVDVVHLLVKRPVGVVRELDATRDSGVIRTQDGEALHK